MAKLPVETLVLEVEGGLLRSSSTFPYFMLVAIEGGGFLRGLLLLLLYPIICFLGNEFRLRVMVMVCFFGVKKNSFRVGSTVLPKFFLEDMCFEEFELLSKAKRRVGVTEMPRLMVESFLKDFLGVQLVFGRELQEFGGFYTGLMKDMGRMEQENAALKDFVFGKENINGSAMGLCSSSKHVIHPVFSHCKEIYLVGEFEKRYRKPVPREKYPKPLIFHDGRLAIRPDPFNSIAIFMWLPFGILLSALRLTIATTLLLFCTIPLAITGIKWTVRGATPASLQLQKSIINRPSTKSEAGRLYICNHKTLLDPNVISLVLKRKASSVSYGLSRFSAMISPIKVNWLTRNLEEDRKRMERILSQGEDLVVCAEGTTCREPYLLRFSPLFTELTNQVVPVAIDLRVSMFYATTVSGRKWMDPFYFFMNPRTCYELEFLEKVDTSRVRAGECSRFDMANHVQRQIGKALGFECTMLRRKDKYMMLG